MPQRAEQLFHKTILCVVLPVLCQCQCRAIRMPQHFKSYQLKGRAKIAKLLLAMLATTKIALDVDAKHWIALDSFGSHTGLHCVHEFCCSSRWKTLRDIGEKAELTERLRPVFYIRNHTQRLFSCIRNRDQREEHRCFYSSALKPTMHIVIQMAKVGHRRGRSGLICLILWMPSLAIPMLSYDSLDRV